MSRKVAIFDLQSNNHKSPLTMTTLQQKNILLEKLDTPYADGTGLHMILVQKSYHKTSRCTKTEAGLIKGYHRTHKAADAQLEIWVNLLNASLERYPNMSWWYKKEIQKALAAIAEFKK